MVRALERYLQGSRARVEILLETFFFGQRFNATLRLNHLLTINHLSFNYSFNMLVESELNQNQWPSTKTQTIILTGWLKYILIFLILCYIIFKSAKDCGSIATPLNGTKHGNDTTYPNKVTLTCDDGFDLKGSHVRECKSDGVWSGEDALCEGNKTLSTLST